MTDDDRLWRLRARHSGSRRPLHVSLECTAVNDPDHYRVVADPAAAGALWCRFCAPSKFPCPEDGCGEVFDSHAAMRGHTASHVEGTGVAFADRLRDTDAGPADYGLSPLGEREGVGD